METRRNRGFHLSLSFFSVCLFTINLPKTAEWFLHLTRGEFFLKDFPLRNIRKVLKENKYGNS